MPMKNINFRILTGILLLILASISCSKHCDDEDYTRDSKPKNAITSDSLKITTTHHNET